MSDTDTSLAATMATALADEATTRAERIAAAEQAAAEAAERVAEAEAEAEAAAKVASKGGSAALTTAMQAIGQAIDTARQAAADAVLGGSDPVAAWVAYRLECQRLLGQWRAIADEYAHHTGRVAPEGPGHRVRSLPGPGVHGDTEGLEEFVHNVLRTAEEDTFATARAAANQEIWSTRGAD